jgi:hypothetical protein
MTAKETALRGIARRCRLIGISVAALLSGWTTDRHCRHFLRLLSPSALLYTERDYK